MKKDPNCLFCNAENFADLILYESGLEWVILNKFPTVEGHILVVPKEHFESFVDMPYDQYGLYWILTKRIGMKLNSRPEFVSYQFNMCEGPEAGQRIKHAHFHTIPYRKGDEPTASRLYMNRMAERITAAVSAVDPKLLQKEPIRSFIAGLQLKSQREVSIEEVKKYRELFKDLY